MIADNSTGTGTMNLIMAGAGTLNLSGTNTYSGATKVNSGVLALNSTNTLTNTSTVIVNTGGTLLFNASNAVNSSATVKLAGTISMSGTGTTETMGALTLTGASIIDFGSGNGNTLTFASLAGLSSTNTLTIYDWSGSTYPPTATTDTAGSTQDRLLFSTDPGLSGSPLLADISFYSDSGTTFLGNGLDLTSGYLGTPELVPVPEPSTIFGSLCLLGLLVWHHRRQLRKYLVYLSQMRS